MHAPETGAPDSSFREIETFDAPDSVGALSHVATKQATTSKPSIFTERGNRR
jgi:hypothetical protein